MTDAGFSRRLHQEVTQWRSEQIITEQQAETILARYASEERQRSPAYLLAFLGAALVGIGVIVFLASNWQSVPAFAKWAIVFSAVFGAYYTGYRLRYEGTTFVGSGTALLFLGALLFGAGIFLVAQDFHVNANAPVLLLLWAVGMLPLAYLLESREMVGLALLDLALAFGWEMGLWLPEAPRAWIGAYLLLGVLFYGLSVLQGASPSLKIYRAPYGILGLLMVLGAMYPLTFGGMNDLLSSARMSFGEGALWRVGCLIGAAILTALAGLRAYRTSPTALAESGALLGLTVVGTVLLFAPIGWGTPGAIFFNLLLLALIIGAIAVGYRNREFAWINVGLIFFWLLVFARYFDWFWNMMPRSLFFIGAGVLLLGGGMLLERNRRRLRDRLREKGEGA